MNKSSSAVDAAKPAEQPKRGSNKRQHQQQSQQQIQQQQQQENQDVIKESGQSEINKINLASHDDMNNQNKQCKTEKGISGELAIPAKSSKDIVQEMIFKDVQDILDNDLSCAICQDIYVNPLILNCSHSFCKFCVYKWLSKKKGCPQCRVRVTFHAENLALRNIINKMVSKSPSQFRETREGVVKQRLIEELKLERDGIPPVLRKHNIQFDDDQLMGLQSFANRINIRFLADDQQYYDDSSDDGTDRLSPPIEFEDDENSHDHDDDEDDDEDGDDDLDDLESDSSDDSDGHANHNNMWDWDDIEDSDDVSFHINGDNSSDSEVSSDSEDEVIESEEEMSDVSSDPSSSAEIQVEWPVEVHDISDDSSDDVDVEESSDVSMEPEPENARCSDDSTVEYDNDTDESRRAPDRIEEYFRNSDTEIEEDDYWD